LAFGDLDGKCLLHRRIAHDNERPMLRVATARGGYRQIDQFVDDLVGNGTILKTSHRTARAHDIEQIGGHGDHLILGYEAKDQSYATTMSRAQIASVLVQDL
jgi:hypothetical protein